MGVTAHVSGRLSVIVQRSVCGLTVQCRLSHSMHVSANWSVNVQQYVRPLLDNANRLRGPLREKIMGDKNFRK